MQIKRFEARNMTEALRTIKKEFGPDAVILSAKNLTRENPLSGDEKEAYIEVLAAVDEAESREAKPLKRGGVSDVAPVSPRKMVSAYVGDETPEPETVPHPSLFGSLASGIHLLSRFKKGKKADGTSTGASSAADVVDAFRRKLVAHGVEERWALELEDILRRSLKQAVSWGTEACNEKILQVFQDAGLSCRPLAEDSKNRRIYGVIGPSGSGKTTTIVRLATLYHHVLGEKVQLVTLDTKRVGASATLQAYARILGVPFEMALDGKGLLQIVASCEPGVIILLDTPPLLLDDEKQIGEFQEIFSVADVKRLALVLSMGMKNEDMKTLVKQCRMLPVKRLIFSKLDETKSFGGILNIMMSSKVPVSFFTSGADLLDGLKVAELRGILNLLLDIEEEHDSDTPPTMGALDQAIDRMMAASRGRAYFVADQKDDIYHHPSCRCVQGIQIENRIVFNSSAEALIKQYRPCPLCCTDPSIQNESVPVIRHRTVDRVVHTR
jgi:flagellar biosynthesis protein FlhF